MKVGTQRRSAGHMQKITAKRIKQVFLTIISCNFLARRVAQDLGRTCQGWYSDPTSGPRPELFFGTRAAEAIRHWAGHRRLFVGYIQVSVWPPPFYSLIHCEHVACRTRGKQSSKIVGLHASSQKTYFFWLFHWWPAVSFLGDGPDACWICIAHSGQMQAAFGAPLAHWGFDIAISNYHPIHEAGKKGESPRKWDLAWIFFYPNRIMDFLLQILPDVETRGTHTLSVAAAPFYERYGYALREVAVSEY